MTVCIAAVAQWADKNAVACCCDMQGTIGSFVRSEDSYKLEYFGHGTIMKAGNISDASEVIALIQPILDQYNAATKPATEFDLRITKLLADLRAAMRKRKQARMVNFLGMDYGMSMEEFRARGSKWFPSAHYATILEQMKNLEIGCELICAYADDSEPWIIEITARGEVIWQDHYAAIGSGSTIALAIMAQSSWLYTPPLMDCLAAVYLAKLTAESDPYVGEGTLFDICVEGIMEDDLSEEGKNYLSEVVKRIAAPKGLSDDHKYFSVTHSRTSKRADNQRTEEEVAKETAQQGNAAPIRDSEAKGPGAAEGAKDTPESTDKIQREEP